MPKALSLIAAYFVALAGVDAVARAGAQPLPPKFKAVPACPAVASLAVTNHIPLAGFDSTLTTNVLHPGDSATILGTMFLKKKEFQWLLYVESETPAKNATNPPPMVVHMFGQKMSFASKPVPAKLQMLGPFTASDTAPFKVHGQTAHFRLNESFLGLGLDRAAAVFCDHPRTNHSTNAKTSKNDSPKLTPDEERAVAGAIPALMSYLGIVEHTEGLEDLLTKLVKLPSVWSIVRHLGISGGIYFGNEATRANPADWDLPPQTPVYYLPCMLMLNGQPSVKITLVVTRPDPPRLICGGVVGLLAERVGDDEIYMTMRVVGAKCKAQP